MVLTVGRRLALGFGVVVVMLSVAVGIGLTELRSTAAGFNHEMDETAASAILGEQTNVAWITQVKLGKDVLLRGQDPAAFADYSKQFADQGKAIKDNVAKLKANRDLTAEEKGLLAEFEKGQLAYEAAFQKVGEVYKSPTADAYLKGDAILKGLDRSPTDALGKFSAGLAKKSVEESDHLQAGADSGATVAMSVAVLAVLLSIGIAFLITRSFTRPLGVMAGALQNLRTGDLNRDIPQEVKDSIIKRSDEFGVAGRGLGEVEIYLQRMAEAAARIAEGDLTVEVVPNSPKDELGNAFVKMVTTLRTTVGRISENATNLSSTSAQLSSASGQAGAATQQIATTIQEVARGNQDQSASVQETTSSVEQLGRAIDQIAKGAQEQAHSIQETSASVSQLNVAISQVASASREVSSAAEQAHQAAVSGAGSVQKSTAGMEAIKSSTDFVASKIGRLGSYSDQIGSIVETIDDIAEQTNLLALNAAIEAARAGEHGRGFAVVADEVRKLAERSSKSTKEIAELIAQVQKETHEAVAAMERGSQEVESGSALAAEAGEALRNILTSVQSATNQATHIAAAVQQMEAASQTVVSLVDSVSAVVEESTAATEEMAASSEQVREAIERVASVSEETSASAEEVSASTEEMSAQVEEMVAQAQTLALMADELHEAVSVFRLATTGAHCWDVMQCGMEVRGKCPAYQSPEDRCWMIPATWCGGVQQGDAASKRHRCMSCKAYSTISGQGAMAVR